MRQLRPFFICVCSLVVLTAVMPVHGIAWCLGGDGSIRLEATGPEGRCLDGRGTGGAASESHSALHPVERPSPCVDLAGVQGQPATNPAAELGQAAVCLPTLFPVSFQVDPALTACPFRPTAPGGEDAGFADITFIRDTVALVI